MFSVFLSISQYQTGARPNVSDVANATVVCCSRVAVDCPLCELCLFNVLINNSWRECQIDITSVTVPFQEPLHSVTPRRTQTYAHVFSIPDSASELLVEPIMVANIYCVLSTRRSDVVVAWDATMQNCIFGPNWIPLELGVLIGVHVVRTCARLTNRLRSSIQ